MKKPAIILLLVSSGLFAAEPRPLPLPDAPVQLVIPDAKAFDRALAGGFRQALDGTLAASDPVGAAWRRTRVGAKLEAQWALFTKDLPLRYSDLVKLQPKEIGLALLAAGDLEAVLAVRTPLAELPLTFPKGEAKTHRGVAYRVASRGGGDDHQATRRIGLAWARKDDVFLVATSERALKLALDLALEGKGVAAFRPGLASLRLDLDALKKDLYFRREFLFAEGLSPSASGIVLSSLESSPEGLVETREGSGPRPEAAAVWPSADRRVAAAGWESDASRLFAALRRGFLEPIPSPSDRPVVALASLPDPKGTGTDRYLVDLTRPAREEGGTSGEGELPRWAAHLMDSPVGGFGWEIGEDGTRRIVMRRPAALDATFASLARETVTRRAGGASPVEGGLVVGPELDAVAWKRTGEWLWIAASPAALRDAPEPKLDPAVTRWSRLELAAVKRAGRDWSRAEGAFSPETTRPFSDRILGLLGWAPHVGSVSVERKQDGARWVERVVFGAAPGESKTKR
ncbi:MAG TPA: hypothetical protein VGR00_06565 [Thermoanaerobaculia bacterium]|nr:hypothetical protein [Thermoanaerobaculia bacterium]